MSAWQAVQELTALLQGLPPGAVPASHVGLRRPGTAGDLPAVVVSATDVEETQAGVGGIVGSRPLDETRWSSTNARRSAGTFGVELWAGDADGLGTLSDAVFDLIDGTGEVVAHGFLRLTVRSVGPGETRPLGAATAIALPVTLAFAFEAVVDEDTGPHGIIRHVHVDMTDTFHEAMDLS